jgi:PPM family protein phosphatase
MVSPNQGECYMYQAHTLEHQQRTQQALTLRAASLSQQGERRPTNQDAVFQRSGQVEAELNAGLYILCDGLGGRRAGEVASRLAVETVVNELAGVFPQGDVAQRQAPLSSSRLDEWLRFAITLAHSHLRGYAQTHWEEARGLSTTIALALIYGSTAHIANVGDSRVYLARAHQLTQLTQDHSMAARLVQTGLIDDSEAATHPHRHILYQALGSHETVEVALSRWRLEPDDTLLLCSDGLWVAFPDRAELAQWLDNAAPPEDLCHQLVSEAIRRDGSDDTSAIIVNVS